MMQALTVITMRKIYSDEIKTRREKYFGTSPDKIRNPLTENYSMVKCLINLFFRIHDGAK